MPDKRRTYRIGLKQRDLTKFQPKGELDFTGPTFQNFEQNGTAT
jgi:hypothetical protein